MNFLSSKNILFIVAVGFALFVGFTTFAPPEVYASWLWFGLWAMVALVIIFLIFRLRIFKKPILFSFHFSLVIIILGGGLSFITSERGTLHLKPYQRYNFFISEDGSKLQLPFSLSLIEFHTDYYPGMSFPRDFHSKILIDNEDVIDVSMNKIGKWQHYRLYQTSFDGEGGSILTVYKDPWGIGLTYTGYFLFIVSGFLYLIRTLSRKNLKVIPCIIIGLLSISNEAIAAPAVSREFSDSLRYKQIIFNGRVVSYARMSSELTLKLTGNTHVGSLDASQFITSLMVYPESWSIVPFLKIKSRPLRKRLVIDGDYVSVSQLYDENGCYLLQQLYSDGTSALDSDILKMDEKIALLNGLWNGTAFQLLENDTLRRNSFLIEMEILYYQIHPVKYLFIITILFSLIAFICIGLNKFTGFIRPGIIILSVLYALIFVWQWIINSYVPLNSTAEILFFVALCAFVILIAVSKTNLFAANICILTAGFVTLLSWLSSKDPVLTPLMPVLSSPWLGAHVSIIMASYTVLGLTFPLSLFAVCCPKKRVALNTLSTKLLLPGTYMLGLGIILGAMWANVSWGRYWAWDPKETWALVTFVLYAIPLHKSFNLKGKPLLLSIYLTLAFLSIIMTYAGVNYLNSLHAYR